jgi:hypothetical protein
MILFLFLPTLNFHRPCKRLDGHTHGLGINQNENAK